MAKRTTRTHRDGRPKLNEAQLQAYRARKAATLAQPAIPTTTEATESHTDLTHHVTHWGHVGDEYEMIRADLIRLFLITIAMFVIIVILWFILA